MNPYDVFARPRKTPISPFELNNEGRGQALVLRYAGCNLGPASCPLCYAWRYSWTSRGYRYTIKESLNALYALPEVVSKKITWVRLQGGEPCLLTRNRFMNTLRFAVHALKIIYEHGLNYYPHIRAVIQTNGIDFAKMPDEQLAKIRDFLLEELSNIGAGRLIFEFSIKSPSCQSLLSRQLKGFRRALGHIAIPIWTQGLDNLALYPIAGLGPSIDFDNTWLVPIDPSFLPQEIPLFHPSSWRQEYADFLNEVINNVFQVYDAYKDFRRNPRTNGGCKVALEELEATLFQTAWISGYAGGYEQEGVAHVPPIQNLLRKTGERPNNQWLALFRRHARWLKVMHEIPISKDPGRLLLLVKQMQEHFYPSHPLGHYPYL